MKGIIVGLALLMLAGYAYSESINPASNALADSANTARTIAYRDANGDFAAGTITVTAISGSGAISTTGGVKASSSTTSNLPFVLDGMYTTAQVQAKTPTAAGQLIYNVTLGDVCVSTGTTIQGYKVVGTASTTCQ